jgi:prepilin-type N-terminal cleavage/methylation domain-containing protein
MIRQHRGTGAIAIDGKAALRGQVAFTLPEVMIAVAILAFLAIATLSTLIHSQVLRAKDHDLGVMQDFAMHYLELVKGLPFNEVKARSPINTLFDGTSGAPLIITPASTNWFSIDTLDFQVFHPELVWFTNRSPQMRLLLTTNQVSGVDNSKHLQLGLRWIAPLNSGGTQSIRLDMVRVKDL